jgi:hypothetical protein
MNFQNNYFLARRYSFLRVVQKVVLGEPDFHAEAGKLRELLP